MSETDHKGGTKLQTIGFAFDHGFEKAEIVDDDDQFSRVYCMGRDHAFVVSREADKKRYSVEAIEKDAKLVRAYDRDFGRYIRAPFAQLGEPLANLVALTAFKVIAAAEEQHDGMTLLRVDFESGGGEKPDKVRVVLEPSRGWVIRSGEIRTGATNWTDVIRYQVKYSPDEADPPVATRAEIATERSVAVADFSEVTRDETPEAEFSMTAYGLPDLVNPKPASSGRQYWLVGLSGAGIVAASAMMVVARRLSARVA